jgi:alkaline phosphatase D
VGRFKTAHPIGSLDVVRVGATSCTSFSYQPYTSLELTADYDLDLFVHLGDQSYNDDDETLSEYRASWRRTLNDPGYRAIYPSTSMLATWDDHEVTNNWDPETISDARRSFATQSYFESLAVERQESGALWHSYRWGDTVEFFVTDNRGERRPSTRTSDDAQYISDEQMEWLQDGLLNSEAHFKVVFSSVPITNMPGLWDLSPADRWEGYASQRSELLDFITGNSLDDVYFLGGDFHIGFVARVEPEGPANSIWEIAVGPGANGPNPLAFLLNEPQFDFSTNGFGTEFVTVLEFDPVSSSVHVLFTDVDGEVLYDEELR